MSRSSQCRYTDGVIADRALRSHHGVTAVERMRMPASTLHRVVANINGQVPRRQKPRGAAGSCARMNKAGAQIVKGAIRNIGPANYQSPVEPGC